MKSELSIELREFLEQCGLSDDKISHCSGHTRMYHDLGLYGDVAEACIEVLAEHYRVDMSGFEFEMYFPPEFAGRNVLTRTLFWIVPFMGEIYRKYGEWMPLTLERIERAISCKRWE